jgi:hypothetical protein
LGETVQFPTLDVYYFGSRNIKLDGGIGMKKSYVSVMVCAVIVALSFFLVTAAPIKAQVTMAGEKAAHPRIVKAIDALQDAVAYMKAAPHDFGGHKADAIRDSEQAIKQLREALKYREVKDQKKLK